MAESPIALSEDFLAQLLIQRQLLPVHEAERWLAEARGDRHYLEEKLIAAGIFTRSQLLDILENHFYCPSVDVRETAFEPAVLEKIPFLIATRHLVLPIQTESGGLKVAFGRPDDTRARAATSRAGFGEVVPYVAFRHELTSAIQQRTRR